MQTLVGPAELNLWLLWMGQSQYWLWQSSHSSL